MKFLDFTKKSITNDAEFDYLDEQLRIHKHLVFNNCGLPAGSTPTVTAVMISFVDEHYSLKLNDRISYNGGDLGFAALCRDRSMDFQTMDEFKAFLRNMNLEENSSSSTPAAVRNVPPHTRPTTDRERLNIANDTENKRITLNRNRLVEDILQTVRGQDEAVNEIAEYASMSVAKTAPLRPISAIFAGGPGQGKTLLCRSLANAINAQILDTQNQYGYIIINCNELIEDHQVSRLVGSPAGYIGYGDETMLSPVAEHPRQVIVFDEFEKASPKVLDVIMGVLDRGELMLAKPIHNNSLLNMKHCILLFTTNLPLGIEKTKTIGFNYAIPDSSFTRYAAIEQYRNSLVAAGIRREIATRFTTIIKFKPLQNDAVIDIVLQAIEDTAQEYGFHIHHVCSDIAQGLYDLAQPRMKYGARMINYTVAERLGILFSHNAANTDCTYDLIGTIDNPQLVPFRGDESCTPSETNTQPIPAENPTAEISSDDSTEDDTASWEHDA